MMMTYLKIMEARRPNRIGNIRRQNWMKWTGFRGDKNRRGFGILNTSEVAEGMIFGRYYFALDVDDGYVNEGKRTRYVHLYHSRKPHRQLKKPAYIYFYYEMRP